ncbi:MAG TPA: DUF4352 domain-containing protein [Dehalococcoidia bacterium]|nr:DUF4352 domain-containing protein [Dehalococcoidia bacterium]
MHARLIRPVLAGAALTLPWLAGCAAHESGAPAAPVSVIEQPAAPTTWETLAAEAPLPATATVGPPIAPQVIVATATVAPAGPAPAPPLPVDRSDPTTSPVAAEPSPSGPGAQIATATPLASPTSTPIPPSPTPWLPQVRDVGAVRITLTELVQGVSPDGRPVVRLRTELANRGDRAAFFADVYFKLETTDGQRHDPITDVESPDRMHQGPLDPGQSTSGYLWYLVPPEGRATAVFYDGPTGQATIPVPGA